MQTEQEQLTVIETTQKAGGGSHVRGLLILVLIVAIVLGYVIWSGTGEYDAGA